MNLTGLPWGNTAFLFRRYLLDSLNDLVRVDSAYHTGSSFNVIEAMHSPSVQLIRLTRSSPIGIIGNENVISEFWLEQNFPNPFNSKSKIKYQIAKSSYVMLKVYDLIGEGITMLVNERQGSGTHGVDFDGGDFPSGVYFYELTAGDFMETKKMVLIK